MAKKLKKLKSNMEVSARDMRQIISSVDEAKDPPQKLKDAIFKKDDTGKPEMMYFYFPGYIALRAESLSQAERCLAVGYHLDVLCNLGDVTKLLNGLRVFEDDIRSSIPTCDGLDPAEFAKNVSTIGKLGSAKYGFLNYTKGSAYSRIMNAMARHVFEFVEGRPIDPESGLDHRYHILSNIYILAEHIENGTGVNDLIKEESK